MQMFFLICQHAVDRILLVVLDGCELALLSLCRLVCVRILRALQCAKIGLGIVGKSL